MSDWSSDVCSSDHALDNGMTPATLVVDGPFCVYQGANLGNKCFRNFGGAGGAGEHTIRWGLEQSRNLMTVRTASQVGMEPIVETIKRKIGRATSRERVCQDV